MKGLAEIQTEIDQTQSKLTAVDQEIAAIKEEAATVKTSNLHLVESQVGNTRKSKSLQVQRKKLFDLQAQKVELKDVRDYLQDRIAELKEAQKLATHYDRVRVWKDHAALWSDKNQEVHQTIQTIADSLAELIHRVQELKDLGHPLVSLRTVLGAIEKDGIAFHEVFEDGLDGETAKYRQAALSNAAAALDGTQKIQDEYNNILGIALFPWR